MIPRHVDKANFERHPPMDPLSRRRWLFGTAGIVACLPAARAADAYPSRSVRLIVSYAAGNITDTLARIVGEKLAEQWKQPVVIDNKGGQGGSLGAQSAMQAPADGYTLLFSAMAAMAINPHVYASVGYNPLTDFTPIVGVGYPSGVLYANPDLKARTLAELVAYSKASPGTLNYGSAGSGTVPHLNMEALKLRTGLVAEHIPYKGAGAVLTDVIGGRLQLAQESLGVVLPQIRAGKVRAMVAFTQRRLPQLPDVPSIGELLPEFQPVTPWLGIFAPAGLPAERVQFIARAVSAALRQPEVIEKLHANAIDVLDAPPAEFAKMVRSDFERLGKLARELKLKVD